MIITIDGERKKRGDFVYEIGVTVDGKYMPVKSLIGSSRMPLTNPDKCWASRESCQAECNYKNEIRKVK